MEKNRRDITGCRFMVSVMSDNFVPLILGAIKKVDTRYIWSKTDTLSTVYRGKRIHVMDCLKACFSNLNDGVTHIGMEATVSKGAPDDTDKDCILAESDILLNNNSDKFDVTGKISFYPLGIANYTEHIAHILKLPAAKISVTDENALPNEVNAARINVELRNSAIKRELNLFTFSCILKPPCRLPLNKKIF